MRTSNTQTSSGNPLSDNRLAQTGAGAVSADAESRRHMIAEAAYFLAEHRGFDGGDPVQDWLTAEAEIDSWLAFDHPSVSEGTAAYLRLRDEVRKAFAQIQDKVDAVALKNAFERGVAEVKHLESFSAEVMHKSVAMLHEDLARAADRMGPTWEHFTERSAGLFSVWEGRGRDFLGRTSKVVREWLHHEARGPRQ